MPPHSHFSLLDSKWPRCNATILLPGTVESSKRTKFFAACDNNPFFLVRIDCDRRESIGLFQSAEQQYSQIIVKPFAAKEDKNWPMTGEDKALVLTEVADGAITVSWPVDDVLLFKLLPTEATMRAYLSRNKEDIRIRSESIKGFLKFRDNKLRSVPSAAAAAPPAAPAPASAAFASRAAPPVEIATAACATAPSPSSASMDSLSGMKRHHSGDIIK